ncbi:MAG: family N-acetyltransferase [Frankiales bacterium]|jgi:GNAT superfamily N-acetyltransferase|nr:family N-acetyltransferase [Frankiales bacterium]
MTRIEVLTPADWRAWRELRLEALRDTPIGFGELHADALLRSDDEWQERMGWPGLRLLAYDPDDAPVGMAGGFHTPEGVPVLFGVYVRPESRGQGVLAQLVDVVQAWAAPDPLTLDVHEDNSRAHAAYLKLGFVETGKRTAGGGIDGRDLVHMVR